MADKNTRSGIEIIRGMKVYSYINIFPGWNYNGFYMVFWYAACLINTRCIHKTGLKKVRMWWYIVADIISYQFEDLITDYESGILNFELFSYLYAQIVKQRVNKIKLI